MLSFATALPARRADLVFRPLGERGEHVVKDPGTGSYYNLGPEESFLLHRLDGRHSAPAVRAAFEAQFGQELSDEDLSCFLSLARDSGFLQNDAGSTPPPVPDPAPPRPGPAPRSNAHATGHAAYPEPAKPSLGGQSLLYCRKSVFDPDRLFGRLEPSLRLLWTRGFVVASAAFVVAAALVSWANRREIVTDFSSALVMRWETVLLAWLILVLATTLHEFAHGLTCKHFGGEVHELGFLLMFFIPCFYCNVSDAWLLREKSRRLWVTLAGAWCDLCAWAVAVCVWRVTPAETVPHYLAWVVMGVCGMRVFFNFNPLLKLDGYYLLSDAAGLPNLRGRAWGRLGGYVRWLLWGASRPAADSRGRFLLLFGAASWGYSALFLCLMAAGLVRWWGHQWGATGAVAALVLGAVASRGLFDGFTCGEVSAMFKRRRARAAAWAFAALAVTATACVVPVPDRAAGPFKLRPLRRAELRAPVAGFLREARVGEGQHVAAGALVIVIEVPDLESKVAQKDAEIAEADAKLAVLRAAPPDGSRASGEDGRVQAYQVAAGEAQVRRLREELNYLNDLRRRQLVESPVEGVIVTPRLAEKVGQYFREGELICEVEDPSVLEAEVAVPEQEMARVRPGLAVVLKARVAPFYNLRAEVTRVAAGVRPNVPLAGAAAGAGAPADTGELPGQVIVYCTVSEAAKAGARAGMTGHARIECGSDPAGKVYGRRLLQYVRTEFWW